MIMFIAAIAYALELALISAGLVFLGNPLNKDNVFHKLASSLLIIGGGLAMLCTVYFSFKYMGQGVFEQAALMINWLT